MIPAFLLVLGGRRLSHRHRHSGPIRFGDLAVEFRAARRDRALRRGLFPGEDTSSRCRSCALLVSDVVLNTYYGARFFDPLILGRYLALIAVGCLGLLLQNRASLKTLLPASLGGLDDFLLHQQRVLLAERSGLHEKLRGLHSGAHDWAARLCADVAVLPQFARERSGFHCGLRSRRALRAERGTFTRHAVAFARCLTWHGNAGATRRSRNALADAVDSAFRGARQSAISSAEDRRLLSPLYRAGSGRGRRGRGGAAG